MLNKFLYWFIPLCSVSAFLIVGLGRGDRVLDLLGIGIMILFLLIYNTYQGKNIMKAEFKYPVLFLFIAVFISVIMAYKIHNQSIGLTIYQQRAQYFLLFYFLLHYLMPEASKLEKMIMILGLLYGLIYIIQTVIYPISITNAKIFWDRNSLRIFMPGASFMILGYFIAFRNIFEKFDWFSLLVLIISLVVTFLLAGRQLIISIFLISYANLMFNKQIKHKIVLTISFMIVIAIVAYLMRNTIEQMIAISLKHSSEGEGYIRFRAAKFFLMDFPRNIFVYLFGNGVPTERSPYGVLMYRLADHYGFFLSDLGIISAYFKFGIIFVIAVLTIFIKILALKAGPRIIYLKNYIISIMVTMFTTSFAFESAEGITAICLILYILDYYKNNPNVNTVSRQNTSDYGIITESAKK